MTDKIIYQTLFQSRAEYLPLTTLDYNQLPNLNSQPH